MGEFLHGNPESSEDEQRYDQKPLELAVNGLSRVVGKQDDANNDSGDFKEEGDYDDDYGEEDDYDEEEDDDYGEEDDYDEEEDDDYGEEDDYDDYGDDDDDYYSEYEEQHYGEERTNFNEEKLTLQEIPLPAEILERYSFLSELPHGIAVMGGVARSIAREIITGEREPIRDIDLVNITDEEGNSEVDYDTLDALSRKFMPDDYAFGHGIENDTLDHYFKTRDFTINQSLIKDGKLIISNFEERIVANFWFYSSY